jgi:YD repeat-containing protein
LIDCQLIEGEELLLHLRLWEDFMNIATRWSPLVSLRRAMCAAATVIMLAVAAQAQTNTKTATDQVTPANLQAGTPEGSYDLSGFENVNLFNGNLNFALPLVHIGGRGSAGYTMTLALNTKTWHVRRTSQTVNGEETNVTYTPTIQLWEAFLVGYGPGTLFGRRSGEGTQNPVIPPCTTQHPLWEKTITRLTFTGPDGSETELRDAATLEMPYATVYNDCHFPAGGFSRGQVFISSDATAMTFISDGNISDVNQVGNTVVYPFGYLFMRDGTRYRIDGGLVSWIQDRNGNRVTFGYDVNNRVSTITDPLNRVVTFGYDQSDNSDHITFIGFGGAQRLIRVVHSPLHTCLRSDFSIQTYSQLFPPNELNGSGNITPQNFDPVLASAVILPNGQQYTINYNSYAEVAQVILPTGGIYEYDYTPTSGVANDNVTGVDFDVFRRVIARRTKPDGVNVESWTKYTPSSTSVIGDTITVDHMDSTGMTLIAREKHSYPTEGIPIQYTGTDPSKFILYKNGMDGKETEVDHLDSDGTTILRTVVNAYQGSSLSWWPGGGGPSYDIHLTDEYTTLLDTGTTNGHPNPGLKSRKHYEYDQYSNVTKTDEYDFGTAPHVGALVRETTTTYLDSIGTSNYRTVNPSLTNPDPAQTIHIRNLPAEQDVPRARPPSRRRPLTYMTAILPRHLRL